MFAMLLLLDALGRQTFIRFVDVQMFSVAIMIIK